MGSGFSWGVVAHVITHIGGISDGPFGGHIPIVPFSLSFLTLPHTSHLARSDIIRC